MQHSYWQLEGAIGIQPLHQQWTGGNVFQTLMITTLAPCRLAVHFGCWISLTGGDNMRTYAQIALISPMWHATYSVSYHMMSEWMQLCPLDVTLLAANSPIHLWEHLETSRNERDCLSYLGDIVRWWPDMWYHRNWKWLGIEDTGEGMKIAQIRQGPQLFGDVAGKLKPTCDTEGISHRNQTNDSCRIHFRY